MKRRSYRQFCGVARALDRVGERWTLLVVRNLLLGPKRYGELLDGLPDITTNLLAKRLKEMEALGLVEKTEHYALTPLGAALEPVVMELGRWGSRFLGQPLPGDRMDIGWAMISLKRRYMGGLSLVAELAFGGRRFELSFSPNYLAVQERPASLPALVLRGDLAAFRALFWEKKPLSELWSQGKLSITGEDGLAARVLGAFQGVALEPADPRELRPETTAAEPRARARSSAAERTRSAKPSQKKAPAARAAKRGA
jgi:DNA-binding HxlR family transcriptional regulator